MQRSTHNRTHLDAPFQFYWTMNQALGEKGRAIAIYDVPLDWCLQPGVKLDFRHFADGYVVPMADVEAELKRVSHTVAPLEMVVVNTRAGSRYDHTDYVPSGCGMGYEPTMYLLERGVRLTATDVCSRDAPLVHTWKKYGESGDALLIWGGHKTGRDIGYCHIKSCTTPSRCRPTASCSSAFRTRSAALRRAGRALSRSSTTGRWPHEGRLHRSRRFGAAGRDKP